jgi:hypothetical protein
MSVISDERDSAFTGRPNFGRPARVLWVVADHSVLGADATAHRHGPVFGMRTFRSSTEVFFGPRPGHRAPFRHDF